MKWVKWELKMLYHRNAVVENFLPTVFFKWEIVYRVLHSVQNTMWIIHSQKLLFATCCGFTAVTGTKIFIIDLFKNQTDKTNPTKLV